MKYDQFYNLQGVIFHLSTDSIRIHEEAVLFLGGHGCEQHPTADFKIEIEEKPMISDYGVAGLNVSTESNYAIVEQGSRVYLRVAEGVAWFDTQTGVCQGELQTQIDGLETVPLLHLLIVRMMFAAGFLPLHAAALVQQERLILLAGERGAGKSTLSTRLGCLGFSLLGDDLVYLKKDGKILLGGAHCQPVKIKEGEPVPDHWPEFCGAAKVPAKRLYSISSLDPKGPNRMYPVESLLFLRHADPEKPQAQVWADRQVEVLYHLIGDGPKLDTPACRSRTLDWLYGDAPARFHLVQTSPNPDNTVKAILDALEV